MGTRSRLAQSREISADQDARHEQDAEGWRYAYHRLVLAGTDIAKIRADFARLQSGRHGKPAPPKRARTTKPETPRAPDKAKARQHPAIIMRAPSTDPVAAAILRARVSANLTQAQLAERLKTDQGTSRALNGAARLQRIAAATGHKLAVDFLPIAKTMMSGLNRTLG